MDTTMTEPEKTTANFLLAMAAKDSEIERLHDALRQIVTAIECEKSVRAYIIASKALAVTQ